MSIYHYVCTLHDSLSLGCFIEVLYEIRHIIVVIVVVVVVASGIGSVNPAAGDVACKFFQVGQGFRAKLVQDSCRTEKKMCIDAPISRKKIRK